MIGQIEKLHKFLQNNETEKVNSGKIITFSSGKGGTGKTFLSLNIAHTLAFKGYKVLFIDFDSNLSNADILINYSASKTILDYFKGLSLLHNVITTGNQNIDYIFGDSGRIEYPRIGLDELNRFINDCEKVSKSYDFVIIDTGAGINNEIVYLLGRSHKNIFVTNPEPTAIMDTYAVLKLLISKTKSNNNYVVVNNSDSETQAKEAFGNLSAAVSHFLKSPIVYLGYVDFDRNVHRAIVDQQLFIKAYPKSKVSAQINQLSEKLAGFKQMANINQL